MLDQSACQQTALAKHPWPVSLSLPCRFLLQVEGSADAVRGRHLQSGLQLIGGSSLLVGLVLNVCFNYGGRWDIAQAAATLAARGEPITEASLHTTMGLAHVPDPDLVIRTGGEMRISNFLLWQSAYTEFVFTDTLWPDFDAAELDRAFADYAGRERRFGQTSDQLEKNPPDKAKAGPYHA